MNRIENLQLTLLQTLIKDLIKIKDLKMHITDNVM
jgi:hypothetical protein